MLSSGFKDAILNILHSNREISATIQFASKFAKRKQLMSIFTFIL